MPSAAKRSATASQSRASEMVEVLDQVIDSISA
jgi:hypothetical protein